MVKTRILIISASFFPDNSPRSFRATELAKEFSKRGLAVTVLTHYKPSVHDEFSKQHGFTIKDLGRRKHLGIEIKGKGFIRLIRRFFSRSLLLIFEYPSIELVWMVKRALGNEDGYDLLISIAVPYAIHWGVAVTRTGKAKIARVWVADCGDPYVGRENDSFGVPFYFKFIERWFMRKADFITVPTTGSIDAYFPEFHNKIRVIPQGFNFNEYALHKNVMKNPCPTFAYAGMFIPRRRDPTELIEFLEKEDRDFIFHIYTKTPQHIPLIKNNTRKKILIHEPVPRAELLQILNEMDFLINFENIGNKQTPSKIIDYLILNKPILSIKTGCLRRDLVLEFLSGNYGGRLVVEDTDQYRIENVCTNFLHLAERS